MLPEQVVTEAVNDTLKAISASLLMEQVLAPRFNFRPKNDDIEPKEGFDYEEEGYKKEDEIVASKLQLKMKRRANWTSKSRTEATIIKGSREDLQEDINKVITAFVQDNNP